MITAEIWNNLINKYIIENVGIKKYTVGKFFDYKMVEGKSVAS